MRFFLISQNKLLIISGARAYTETLSSTPLHDTYLRNHHFSLCARAPFPGSGIGWTTAVTRHVCLWPIYNGAIYFARSRATKKNRCAFINHKRNVFCYNETTCAGTSTRHYLSVSKRINKIYSLGLVFGAAAAGGVIKSQCGRTIQTELQTEIVCICVCSCISTL